MDKLNRVIGCLIGGACGDALGYIIEFDKIKKIRKVYGEQGITDFEKPDGKAIVSDDTQMTLFTAAGILRAKEQNINYLNSIWRAYKDWYYTQNRNSEYQPFTDIYRIDALHKRRAPGNTCISTLRLFEKERTIEKPGNLSKGCGGIIRVAPIGCIDLGNKPYINGWLGAEAAALTHGHQLGYIPAGFLADLIHRILISKKEGNMEEFILDSLNETIIAFKDYRHIEKFDFIIKKAISLSKTESVDLNGIVKLGKGWVAEETAAIAVYSCLRHSNDFRQAMICAVNHSGDSDSTGSVAGNILGAYLGLEKIEKAFDIESLDQYETILYIAEQLSTY
ncbi:ADP-ribosylglycohydrolase family protein [Hungatella hathewayi]|uniref:ADP-ribosylglycohydrolase family protein n=1 Tax=Hungatella hathewayi TaxID=154046 RepID=UPI0035658768